MMKKQQHRGSTPTYSTETGIWRIFVPGEFHFTFFVIIVLVFFNPLHGVSM